MTTVTLLKYFKTIQDDELVNEQMLNDSALAVKVGGIILTIAGCSHSGISNIAKQTKKVTGVNDVILCLETFQPITDYYKKRTYR